MSKSYFFIITLLFTIFLNSCKTNPPSEIEIVVENVKVFISSNVDSAAIYVNDSFTGKYTPDTVIVKTGINSLKLIKDGYNTLTQQINIIKGGQASFNFALAPVGLQKIVLMESFSNVGCAPCVSTNSIINSLKDSYGYDKLLVIKFPTNFPAPNDVFYTANKTENNARIAYYNILSAPTVILDGVLKATASDSNNIKSKIDARSADTAKFVISVSDSIANNTIFIKTKVQNFAYTGSDFSDLILHTVIVEKDIEFATPPGSNGEKIFHNVMRKMLPDQSGTELVTIPVGGSNSFSFEQNIASSWQQQQLYIISFIQNKTTKDILQAGSSKLKTN